VILAENSWVYVRDMSSSMTTKMDSQEAGLWMDEQLKSMLSVYAYEVRHTFYSFHQIQESLGARRLLLCIHMGFREPAHMCSGEISW
jgi:hypothetical protein